VDEIAAEHTNADGVPESDMSYITKLFEEDGFTVLVLTIDAKDFGSPKALSRTWLPSSHVKRLIKWLLFIWTCNWRRRGVGVGVGVGGAGALSPRLGACQWYAFPLELVN